MDRLQTADAADVLVDLCHRHIGDDKLYVASLWLLREVQFHSPRSLAALIAQEIAQDPEMMKPWRLQAIRDHAGADGPTIRRDDPALAAILDRELGDGWDALPQFAPMKARAR